MNGSWRFMAFGDAINGNWQSWTFGINMLKNIYIGIVALI